VTTDPRRSPPAGNSGWSGPDTVNSRSPAMATGRAWARTWVRATP
jgi:hypothetical protein